MILRDMDAGLLGVIVDSVVKAYELPLLILGGER